MFLSCLPSSPVKLISLALILVLYSSLFGSFEITRSYNKLSNIYDVDTNSSINVTKPVAVAYTNRSWDRMLIGIFSYDGGSKQEALRQAHRDTHLSYYKKKNSTNASDMNTVCNLQELMTNSSLLFDPISCRIVYILF